MFGKSMPDPATTGKILAITVLILVTFCLPTAEGSISETIDYSAGFTNNLLELPPNFPIDIIITPVISGTITVTGPAGYTWTESISGPGPDGNSRPLGAAGTYTVAEDYIMEITGTIAGGLLPPITETYSASATSWKFDAAADGATGNLGVSSSFSSLVVSDRSNNISVSISGLSATVTTTEAIKIGDSVSVTASGQWNVTTSMTVSDAPIETGTVKVNTNHANATFDITGPADRSGDGQSETWPLMEVGVYTATFGDIPDYFTPAPQIKTLTAGGTITFTADYVSAIQTGTVEVFTNRGNATFSVAGPTPRSGDGTYEPWPDMQIGQYTITFDPIDGYITPKSEPKTLTADGTIIFNGVYKAIVETGTVRVTTNNEAATFEVTGPDNRSGSGISKSWSDMPVGSYTAIFYDVEGYVTPAPANGMLAAGRTITLNGEYVLPTTINNVVVSDSPARRVGDVITVTLTGEPGCIASFSIPGVVENVSMEEKAEQPGTYEGTYSTVAGLNISGAKVVATLTDAVGNTSTDESQTVSICTLPWDINEDGIVDALDIGAVSSHLGKTVIPELDLNGDGRINMLDVLVVAIHYGEQCDPDGESLASAPFAPYAVPNYLYQNYPNPCNPGTWIPFMLAEGQEVAVSIYNPSGQLIRRLDLGYKDPGIYVSRESGAYWDGSNESGEQVASGVYFYHIQAGRFSAVRKMLVSR